MEADGLMDADAELDGLMDADAELDGLMDADADGLSDADDATVNVNEPVDVNV